MDLPACVPTCIGVISGTHVAILSLVHHNHEYVSWKGYFLTETDVDNHGHLHM